MAPLESLLHLLRAETTGTTIDIPEGECACDLGNGWALVWSEDDEKFDADFGVLLSRAFPIVTVQIDETAMISVASFAQGGVMEWGLVHAAPRGHDHLDVFAGGPQGLDDAIADAKAAQADDPSADYFFDVPLRFAKEICGFKHDELQNPGPKYRLIRYRGR
ncbi:hypothetical protein WJT74_11340 [Sphingomicrobium sp. XHP0239]|uniref:hypothetical protein n=1 Tax=Sphingomicrobium maritimum TaxID=3133972 RepID=UPI0031CC93DB